MRTPAARNEYDQAEDAAAAGRARKLHTDGATMHAAADSAELPVRGAEAAMLVPARLAAYASMRDMPVGCAVRCSGAVRCAESVPHCPQSVAGVSLRRIAVSLCIARWPAWGQTLDAGAARSSAHAAAAQSRAAVQRRRASREERETHTAQRTTHAQRTHRTTHSATPHALFVSAVVSHCARGSAAAAPRIAHTSETRHSTSGAMQQQWGGEQCCSRRGASRIEARSASIGRRRAK